MIVTMVIISDGYTDLFKAFDYIESSRKSRGFFQKRETLKIMVIILDGYTGVCTHVRSDICYLTCLRHFFFIESSSKHMGFSFRTELFSFINKSIFFQERPIFLHKHINLFFRKELFSFIYAQPVLSYHEYHSTAVK